MMKTNDDSSSADVQYVAGKTQHLDLLMKLSEEIKLFHTSKGDGYAVIDEDGIRKVWPIKSPEFRSWLKVSYFNRHHKFPSTNALQNALDLLDSRARHESKQREIFVRIAEEKGAIYVDLSDGTGRAAKITKNKWKIVSKPKALFLTVEASAKLSMPKRRNSLKVFKKMRHLFNTDEKGISIIIAWLIGALNPIGPYPILALQGEPGSGKSTVGEMLKRIIDPNDPLLRTLPRNEHELMIAAKRNWILVYDNVSRIPTWMSDAFCRLSSGGGMGVRKLFNDDAEVIFTASRPIILNGIGHILTRDDLADRALVVEMKAIEDTDRKVKESLMDSFEELRPYILGALFEAASEALKNKDAVEMTCYQRLADFQHWVVSAEPAVFKKEGIFSRLFEKNRRDIGLIALESDPVASSIKSLLDHSEGEWKGTASDLLKSLSKIINSDDKELFIKEKSWPTAPNALSVKLKELAPPLRAIGIRITFLQEKGKRMVQLRNK